MSDSGETAPTAQPARPPGIPPRPPAPPASGDATSAQPRPGEGYPLPPEYATLPYPAQYRPVDPAAQAPRAYAPPTGYAAPPPVYGPYAPPVAARTRGGAGLGVVALILGILAGAGATTLGAIAAYNIGVGTGRSIALQPVDADFDWSILTPVRDWVLLGETAFWVGTILGTWALAQGIVAIAKNRGRGWGIAAVVVAVLGPIAFAVGVQVLLAAGFVSGATVGS